MISEAAIKMQGTLSLEHRPPSHKPAQTGGDDNHKMTCGTIKMLGRGQKTRLQTFQRNNHDIAGGDRCGGRERPCASVSQPRLAARLLRRVGPWHQVRKSPLRSREGAESELTHPLQGDP